MRFLLVLIIETMNSLSLLKLDVGQENYLGMYSTQPLRHPTCRDWAVFGCTRGYGFKTHTADIDDPRVSNLGREYCCFPYHCAVPSTTSWIKHTDYGSCVGGRTGDMCTPVCQPGYYSLLPASSFQLICNDDGSFDDFDRTLNCLPTCTNWADHYCGEGYTAASNANVETVLSIGTCCTKCPKHCKLCTFNPQRCDDDQCSSGYLRVPDGSCQPCPTNCKTCVADLSKCDFGKCYAGYKLSSDFQCIELPLSIEVQIVVNNILSDKEQEETCADALFQATQNIGVSRDRAVCTMTGLDSSSELQIVYIYNMVINFYGLNKEESNNVLKKGKIKIDLTGISVKRLKMPTKDPCSKWWTLAGPHSGCHYGYSNRESAADITDNVSRTICCKKNQCSMQAWPGWDAAEYRQCVNLSSGDKCKPECIQGYVTTEPPTGFTMICDIDGGFKSLDPSLVCSETCAIWNKCPVGYINNDRSKDATLLNVGTCCVETCAHWGDIHCVIKNSDNQDATELTREKCCLQTCSEWGKDACKFDAGEILNVYNLWFVLTDDYATNKDHCCISSNECIWNGWSSWSECSGPPCGVSPGKQTRVRTKKSGTCNPQDGKDTRPCNNLACSLPTMDKYTYQVFAIGDDSPTTILTGIRPGLGARKIISIDAQADNYLLIHDIVVYYDKSMPPPVIAILRYSFNHNQEGFANIFIHIANEEGNKAIHQFIVAVYPKGEENLHVPDPICSQSAPCSDRADLSPWNAYQLVPDPICMAICWCVKHQAWLGTI